jgi:hypothetical protein
VPQSSIRGPHVTQQTRRQCRSRLYAMPVRREARVAEESVIQFDSESAACSYTYIYMYTIYYMYMYRRVRTQMYSHAMILCLNCSQFIDTISTLRY